MGNVSGDVPPGGDSEGATHEERHSGAEAKAGRGPEAEAERAPGAEAGRSPEDEAGGGPEPEAEAESSRGPEVGGDGGNRSPLHLGRPWGWPRRREAESSPQSRGGSNSTPSSRGRTANFSSSTPASMEPLL